MTITPFESTDYLETARDRVTEQFKDKEVFDRYLQLMVTWQNELQEVAKDLKQLRSVDTALGAQLDILGAIVGQPRQIAARDYSNFLNEVPEEEQPKLPIVLNDEQYRLFIKARIMKNVTDTTPESLIQAFNFLFGTDMVILNNVGYATIRIDVSKEFNAFELAVLEYAKREKNLLPIAVGVGFDIASFDEDAYFAFDGFPNAKGFGTLVNTVGYDGKYSYGGGQLHNGTTTLRKTPATYTNFLDGSFDLDGSEDLDGGIIAEGEVIGGKFSSLLNI